MRLRQLSSVYGPTALPQLQSHQSWRMGSTASLQSALGTMQGARSASYGGSRASTPPWGSYTA